MVLSVQCAGDRCGQQIDEVVDVVEVLETDHRSFDGVGAVAAGDAVGQGVKLGDDLVVGHRIPRRTVWRDDADLMHVAVAGGHREIGAEPFGDRSASASDSSRCTSVTSISDQMSSASRRAGVNCSGSALPSSSAAAVA